MKQYAPSQWRKMIEAFRVLSLDLEKNKNQDNNTRSVLKRKIASLQKSIEENQNSTIAVPPEFPQKLADSANYAINIIRDQQVELAKKMKQIVNDFTEAEENEDRFVILVFGEVNAGKSGIANHIAGCDFDLPDDIQRLRQMFVGNSEVRRLGEKAVECTSEYQGFRLPGLHWIDCPGVLSTTMKNSDLAKRLLGRADFICFVSSSDAPLKESEMGELAKLVKESGVDKVDAFLLITKADEIIEDEDWETESIIRRLVRKDGSKISEQSQWCKEQLERTGVASYLRVIEPLPISIYIARDRIGRDWVTGGFRKEPYSDWETTYEESGITELCNRLTRLATEQGAAIKANWPRKKEASLRRMLSHTAIEALDGLEKLEEEVSSHQKEFLAAENQVSQSVAIHLDSRVYDVLVKNGVNEVTRFNRLNAENELNKLIFEKVNEISKKQFEKMFSEMLGKLDKSMHDFTVKMNITFDLQERTRTKTYKSTVKGETGGELAGRAGGATVGGRIGAAIGSVFTPAGTAIGGLIGATLGGMVGGYLGKKMGSLYVEDITIEEKIGTNADEVIKNTQKIVKDIAISAVKQTFERVDRHVFLPFLTAISEEKKIIIEWLKSVELQTAEREAAATISGGGLCSKPRSNKQ